MALLLPPPSMRSIAREKRERLVGGVDAACNRLPCRRASFQRAGHTCRRCTKRGLLWRKCFLLFLFVLFYTFFPGRVFPFALRYIAPTLAPPLSVVRTNFKGGHGCGRLLSVLFRNPPDQLLIYVDKTKVKFLYFLTTWQQQR